MKKIFALFLVLFTVSLLQTSFAQLNLAPDDHSVLILAATVSGGASSPEALAAAQNGMTVVISPSWATFTAIDFASYRAVVIGDPTCAVGNGDILSAEATTFLWGGVVNASGGHVVMIGTDPTFHYSQGGDSLIYGCMRFVLSDDPTRTKTGAYLCLSCYYNNICPGPDNIILLDGLEAATQNFTMTGGSCPTVGCYNDVHKTASHPALVNVTDATLSGWSCSLHEVFNAWDILNYDVLAIGLGLFGNYTAPDGTVGSPYILARGASVISDIDLASSGDTVCNIGFLNTLTATVSSGGSPIPDGTIVTFTAIGGVCSGLIGTAPTTGGVASVTHNCATPGDQFIVATFIDALGHTQTSNTVKVVWKDCVSPVEMSSFTSNINGRDVTLNWTTSMEQNNAGFDVERAAVTSGELVWTRISNVSGNGTTNESKSYSFVDRNVNPGTYNYRLKQIDFNGNFAYHNLSNEIVIGIPNTFNLSQNYPNPFNPSTKIGFQIPNDGNVVLSVYDNSGKLVSTIMNGFRAAGYYTVDFNASSISSGIYFYKIQYSANGQDMFKVMKMAVVK